MSWMKFHISANAQSRLAYEFSRFHVPTVRLFYTIANIFPRVSQKSLSLLPRSTKPFRTSLSFLFYLLNFYLLNKTLMTPGSACVELWVCNFMCLLGSHTIMPLVLFPQGFSCSSRKSLNLRRQSTDALTRRFYSFFIFFNFTKFFSSSLRNSPEINRRASNLPMNHWTLNSRALTSPFRNYKRSDRER